VGLSCSGAANVPLCSEPSPSASPSAVILSSSARVSATRATPRATSAHPHSPTSAPAPPNDEPKFGSFSDIPSSNDSGSHFFDNPSTQFLWIMIGCVLGVTILMCSCLMWAHSSRKRGPKILYHDDMDDAYSVGSRRSNWSIFRSNSQNNSIMPKFSARLESLEENRANHDYAAIQLANQLVQKNKGSKDFPVKWNYSRLNSDEVSLANGDTVVLYKAYPDGWGEGVSRRFGGPAIFPLSCLGGPVPRALMDSQFLHQYGSTGGDSQMVHQRLHQTPVFMRPESMHQTVVPVLPRGSIVQQKRSNLVLNGPQRMVELTPESKFEVHGSSSLESESMLYQQDLAVSYNPFKASRLQESLKHSRSGESSEPDFPNLSFNVDTRTSSVLDRYLPRQSVYSDIESSRH
jgi:hypothetical protein